MLEYPSFSDFATDESLIGEKIQIEKILNKKVLITKYRTSKSKFKESNYTTIQFKYEDKLYVIFTGSDVLIRQLEKYKDKLPFNATIIKIGKYYTLS